MEEFTQPDNKNKSVEAELRSAIDIVMEKHKVENSTEEMTQKVGAENTNQKENVSPAAEIETATFLKSLFDGVEDFPDKETWCWFWSSTIIKYGAKDEEFKNFFKNISKSDILRTALLTTDSEILGTLSDKLMSKVYVDPNQIEDMVHNATERREEKFRNNIDKYERIFSNPLASAEEYEAGIYRESIEHQVRDAVFELQKKGYSPIESGFMDIDTGSQYIGINKEESVDAQVIADSFNKKLDEKNKKLFSEILVKEYDDRVQIILIPKIKTMPLGVWKFVWDDVASCIPEAKDSLQSKKNNDNGNQGRDFRGTQDQIKEGRDAWLAPGLAFVDGKVVPMSYKDFIKIENQQKIDRLRREITQAPSVAGLQE